MASQAALRQRVFDKLYSNSPQSRPARQRLAAAFTAGSETAVVDDGTPITPGAIIEFPDGHQAYVVSVATNTLTLWEAQNGTTSANVADNSFISIDPVHTIQQVDDAMNETMLDLQAQGIYILRAGTDITLVSGTEVYELTETDYDPQHGVKAVFYQETSDSRVVGLPFRNVYDAGLGVFTTSGLGIRLLDWGNNSSGDSLEVLYAAKVNALADTDNEPLLEDLIVMGAVGRILTGKEGPRLHDPGRYTDRTVQPGQHIRDGGFYLAQYQRQVWRYRGHLRAREGQLPGAEYMRARRFRRA